MSLYHDVLKQNFLKNIAELVNDPSSPYELCSDGKVRFKEGNLKRSAHPVWIHVRLHPELDCNRWHKIYFNYYHFIPAECHDCWKVVVRPKNLVQHLHWYAVMKGLDVPSKLGKEPRFYVEGLWGAYFYTRSPDEGLERWKQIRALVDEHLDKDTPVILKRGCTEFEREKGDSSLWKVTDGLLRFERFLDSRFDLPKRLDKTPESVITMCIQDWIEFAAAWGDMSYRQFTDGKKIYRPYRTYHPGNGQDPQAYLKDEWVMSAIDTVEKEAARLAMGV